MEGPAARLTAMAEVLQIMSRTSFELRAVLEAVVERASRLCRADAGFIYRLQGEWYRLDVAYNIPPNSEPSRSEPRFMSTTLAP